MVHPVLPALSRRSFIQLGGTTALAVGASASLAGCSQGSAAADKTLRLAYFGDQKSADQLRTRLLVPVQKLDPGIDLQVIAVNGTDWNDFFTKILTQIAAGTPPDIVGVPTEGLQLIAQRKLAAPLDDYVKRDMDELKPYFADVHPSLVEAMMYDGHLYELPVDFNAGNMFYNPTLFDKAGADLPAKGWTLDDFGSAAAKLGKLSGVNAFDWVVRLWGSWTSFMYANGANLLEEGKFDGGSWLWDTAYAGVEAAQGRSGGWRWGQPTANSPAVVEALDYMIDLRKRGLSPTPDVGGGDTLQGLFASGQIGMAIGGGFWAGGLHNAGMKDGTFDVASFPRWKTSRQLLGTGGFAMFESSKKKDLAWQVIKTLLTPESFDLLYPGNTTTSARKSLATAERYQSTGPKHWETFYDTLTDDPTTAPIPAPPYYNALAASLNRATTSAISTGDAKAALDVMQRELEAAATKS